MKESDTWRIIKGYFEDYGFFRHQFDSYNDFVFNDIESIIKNEGNLKSEKYEVIFEEVYVSKP
mgnify:CR=1 FL=1